MSSMDFLLLKDFFQRVDKDGTARSICVYCFQTVASVSNKTDLERAEAEHLCPKKKMATQLD
jgi:hypothetical protein